MENLERHVCEHVDEDHCVVEKGGQRTFCTDDISCKSRPDRAYKFTDEDASSRKQYSRCDSHTYRRSHIDRREISVVGCMTPTTVTDKWVLDVDHPDRNKAYGCKSFGHAHARAWVGRKHRYENRVARKELKESIAATQDTSSFRRRKSHADKR